MAGSWDARSMCVEKAFTERIMSFNLETDLGRDDVGAGPIHEMRAGVLVWRGTDALQPAQR